MPEVKTDYITVTAPPPGAITLDVRVYKVKGTRTADLTWSGADTDEAWSSGATALRS